SMLWCSACMRSVCASVSSTCCRSCSTSALRPHGQVLFRRVRRGSSRGTSNTSDMALQLLQLGQELIVELQGLFLLLDLRPESVELLFVMIEEPGSHIRSLQTFLKSSC